MKTNSMRFDFSVLLLSFFVVISSVHNSYQEQYKYSGIDLSFLHTDTTVECLVDPDQNHFMIRPILSGFKYSNTNLTNKIFSNLYSQRSVFQYDLRHIRGINPENLLNPPGLKLFHPFISVLYKSQPIHSCEEDNPLPANC